MMTVTKKICFTVSIAICAHISASLYAQTAHQNLREGDGQYRKEKYQDAENVYRKADAAEPSVSSRYNLGNALMKQEREEEAVLKYEEALGYTQDKARKADILHNLGNAYFAQQEYDKSIEAYKKSLQYRPDDQETKQNLALARTQKKIQQQQQSSQDKNNQGSENKDSQSQSQNSSGDNSQNSEERNEENSGQNDDNQNSESGNSSEDQESEEGDNENPAPGGERMMSKDEAERLLDIMDEEERKVQQKLRKGGSERSKPKKDW